MARSTTYNPKANLLVCESLANRIKAEMEFLNLDSPLLKSEAVAFHSRSEMIRYITDSFVERWLQFDQPPVDHDISEQRVNLSCQIPASTTQRWAMAMGKGLANSRNDLVNLAIADYFCREDQTARAVELQAQQLESALSTPDNLAAIREVLPI